MQLFKTICWPFKIRFLQEQEQKNPKNFHQATSPPFTIQEK